MRQHIDMVAE
jgi:hypothetical protein